MSKTKRALPEDIDVTDDRATVEFSPRQEPDQADWNMAQLSSVLIDMERNPIRYNGYVSEMKLARQRLQEVINNTLKPF